MILNKPNISSTQITDYGQDSWIPYVLVINYFTMKNIKLQPVQIALLNAMLCPEYIRCVGVLSRRTGKTFIGNSLATLKLLEPGTRCTVVAPNYSLSAISFDIQQKELKELGVELVRANQKDKVLELVNGSVFKIGSISQSDNLVGVSNDFVLFDEFGLSNNGGSVFNTQIGPTLDKPNSKALFISTPRGRANSLYDFFEKGKEPGRWFSMLGTYKDNHYTAPEVIAEAKSTMSKAEFGQEFECKFSVMQGLIWDMPSESIQSRKGEPLDIIAGLDVGYRDPTHLVVIAVYEDAFHILDEYQANEQTTEKYAKHIKKLLDKYEVDYLYVDSAAAQMRYDFAQNYDISSYSAKKDVLPGLGFVASLIENGQITIDEKCDRTIECFNNYVWAQNQNAQGTYLKEKPLHNKYSHAADAVRYAIYTHGLGISFTEVNDDRDNPSPEFDSSAPTDLGLYGL